MPAVVETMPGRSIQLNAGAARAFGDILFFLHAHNRLPARALVCVSEVIYVELLIEHEMYHDKRRKG